SHHRLEQDRASPAHAFLEAHRAGHLEGVFVRVDVVVRTEEQRDLHIDDRVAGQHARRQRVANTLFDCGNVFARNHTTLDRVDEFEAFATRGQGLELEYDVAILTPTAGWLDQLAFDFFARLRGGFTIGHLRLANVGFNAELATHAVDQNFQVKLAHTGNDGLAGLFVAAHAERRSFLGQARQRNT